MKNFKKKNVLVACEYSGIVSQAFYDAGHNVLSCDILPSDNFHNHFTGNIFDVPGINVPGTFDLMIGFPPCTYLCKAQMFRLLEYERRIKFIEAMAFVKSLYSLPINQICIENPVGALNNNWKKPAQIIYPYNFGDPYRKDICLWLKNLPPLINMVQSPGRKSVSNHVNGRMSQDQKSKIKSKFFPGVATAMALQWGSY